MGLGIILIFTLGNLLDPSVRPLVMGATFGIALTLVIIAGSELFTGHTMFLTLGVKAGTIRQPDMWRTFCRKPGWEIWSVPYSLPACTAGAAAACYRSIPASYIR